MCTLSWTQRRGGYDLFFNRDELNSRAPEVPPTRGRRECVQFVAPRDGAHGGTWIVANEHGLTVCLLNDYANPWQPSGRRAPTSRGAVVLACAGARNIVDVLVTVHQHALERVRPFQLAALAPDEPPLILHWDGRELLPRADAEAAHPLSSSSFESSRVVAVRRDQFLQAVSPQRSAGELAAYHQLHRIERGAESVLMRRSDASTRSLTQVHVNPREVRMHYAPVRWAESGPEFSESIQCSLARRPAL